MANYYQLAATEPLFVFDHPNFPKEGDKPDNTRYKSIRFPPIKKAAVLTGFAGFFETILHGNVTLSTNPDTHTPDMVSFLTFYLVKVIIV